MGIYASETGRPGRVLLFEFDPGSPYIPLPDVTVADPHTIEISVASVSSIFSHRDD